MRALLISVMGLAVASMLCVACGETNVAPNPGKACTSDSDCQQSYCYTGTCDLDTKVCTNYVIKTNYCFIGDTVETCHVAGEVHGIDQCKVCEPTEDSESWSPVQCLTGQICASNQGCVAEEMACKGDDSVCTTDDPCMSGSCGGNGFCAFTPQAGAACDDSNDCTENDTCDDTGQCLPGNYTCACEEDGDCPGGNACQSAVCTDNACGLVDVTDGAGCDDLDACTEGDSCSAGVCQGTPMVCPASDGDPTGDDCNEPVCDNGECTTEFVALGTACDDESDCTAEDACDDAGVCIGAWDSNKCPCQKDEDCAGTAATCQVAVCGTGGQCQSQDAPDGTSCDDQDACTSNTTCQAGACDSSTGSPISCPDTGSPCTFSVCESPSGCETKNKDATTTCNDGKYCTSNDHCDGNGGCVGGGDTLCPNDNDQNECTTKVCDEDTDGCENQQLSNGTVCAASSVCVKDAACQSGLCVDGAAITCSDLDNNACTTETCEPNGNVGCEVSGNAANGTSCGNDGATCNNGVCETPECTKDAHCIGDPCKQMECQSNECVWTKSLTGSCGDKKMCIQAVCTDVECVISSDCSGPCKLWNCTSSYTCQAIGSKKNGTVCTSGKITGTCQLGECKTSGGFVPDPKN